MPLDIKTLAIKTLGSSAGGEIYTAPSATLRSAIISGMRFTNTGANTATVQVFFKRLSGTERRVLPVNLKIPPQGAFIDSDELTLGPGDSVVGNAASGDTVHVVVSGTERPA